MTEKGESGFTLLEVLVCVFIVAVVLACVYGAYTSNVQAIQSARLNGQVNQIARIVLDRMCNDLESAVLEIPVTVSGVSLGMTCENGEIDGKPADRINFTSLAHLPIGEHDLQTDLCEIGYYVEEMQDAAGLILYRRDDPTPDDNLAQGGSVLQVTKGIAGLNIILEDARGEIFEHWDTGQRDFFPGLPALIRIELVILDETGKEHLFRTSVHPAMSKKQ